MMEEICVTNNNPCNDSGITIANFLAGKNVFITGGSGFLGTVLIERLLSATPDIGNIYVLIRAKRGHTPENRIERLLSKTLFENLNEKDKAKVKPVVGELTEIDFGIKGALIEKLKEEVNIVYHVAATIKFNSFLGTAIKINVVGTHVCIKFAKELRKLSSFIYVSTAFCNSCYLNQGIMEKVYPSDKDPYEMLKLIDPNNNEGKEIPDVGSDAEKEILGIHPNSYTFTKQLAENLIQREMQNLPVGIMRPSIVYGTFKHPEGWVGSASSGHIGFLAGYSKGLFRTMCGNSNYVMDLIPCDYVVNAIVVLSHYVGTHPIAEPEVIHCTSGELNSLTIGEFCTLANEATKKHPNDFIICQPQVKVRNGWRFTTFMYLFHMLPAILLYIPERLIPVRKPARRVMEYVKIFNNGIKVFDYFMNQNFHYNMKNSLKVLDSLNLLDSHEYNYNVKYCDWGKFMETQIIGTRYYFFKEAKETTKLHRLMWYSYGLVQWLWYIVAFHLFNSLFSTFLDAPIATAISIIILIFVKWI